MSRSSPAFLLRAVAVAMNSFGPLTSANESSATGVATEPRGIARYSQIDEHAGLGESFLLVDGLDGLLVVQCLNRIETGCTDGGDHAANQSHQRQDGR